MEQLHELKQLDFPLISFELELTFLVVVARDNACRRAWEPPARPGSFAASAPAFWSGEDGIPTKELTSG